MVIDIWDRRTNPGEQKTVVEVNGSATQHETHDGAYEYLHGKVRELQSAVDTAISMHKRYAGREEDDGGVG